MPAHQRRPAGRLVAGALLGVVLFASSLGACAGRRSRAPNGTPNAAPDAAPTVIAHRGASGHRPEHTLAAYALAIDMGADFVEPDLVRTKDGVLVARHENEIGGTTDVARKFPERRATKTVDGASITGWFVEDFTLAELKTLRATERLPFRSHAHDGEEPVPTFEEILALVERRSRETGRRVGVYPETKHPSYFRSLGLPIEEPLVAALRAHGLDRPDAPVFVQSFETENLKRLRGMTRAPLVQLMESRGAPFDRRDGPDATTYAAMATPDGLAAVRRYADAVGVEKNMVQPVAADGSLGTPTSLVADAHRAGLRVHVWTLRSDSTFLPRGYGGDAAAEWRRFASLGVDGIFGDFPDVGVRALRRGVTGP